MTKTTDCTYLIDGSPVTIRMQNAHESAFGPDEVLSTAQTDIVHGQDWYDRGYCVRRVFSTADFDALRAGIRDTLARILTDLGRDATDLTLENYHRLVDDETHYQVVGRTRDLFARDFNLDIDALHGRLGAELGFDLTDIDPHSGDQLHIIVRINRPGSTDFNPVHKDIYEAVDHEGYVVQMVNFWIPICGVTAESSLPLAPGSHLLPESKILRTRAGSMVEGKTYRVNSILSWDGQSALERPKVRDGEALIFSSHLIHGLGRNGQSDTTRIALEFRLFRKNPG